MKSQQTQKSWEKQRGFEVDGWGDAQEARINSIVSPSPRTHQKEAWMHTEVGERQGCGTWP